MAGLICILDNEDNLKYDDLISKHFSIKTFLKAKEIFIIEDDRLYVYKSDVKPVGIHIDYESINSKIMSK